MDPQLKLWGTILGYMLLALTISACTSLWIRYHLKRNDLHPRRAIKKRYLILKRRRKRLDSKRRRYQNTHHFSIKVKAAEVLCYQSPSSRGLGHRPFTAVTGVRIPLGTPIFGVTCQQVCCKASDKTNKRTTKKPNHILL